MPLLDSFRAARWLRTSNFILQGLLMLSFVAGLNYLSLNYSWRFDLTAARRYSLSAETLANLRDRIERPVQLIVTLDDEDESPTLVEARDDVRGLLGEYVYATESRPDGQITVRYLNVDQRPREADELGVDQRNVIYAISGDRRRIITLAELYEVGANGARTAFLGEQAVTAALLDVTSAEQSRIYFLIGHNELLPDNVDPTRGLSRLRDQLQLRNYQIERLDLSVRRTVPADASLVIAVQPQGVDDAAENALRQYVQGTNRERPGSMIVVLAPGQDHRLDDLLDDWGIRADPDQIVDDNPSAIDANGDLILRNFADHPVSRAFRDEGLSMSIGAARSVTPDRTRAAGGALTLTVLAATSTTAWGERNFALAGSRVYNEGIDLKGGPDTGGRLGVIVASERTGASANIRFSVPRGRVIVFGGDVVSNVRLENQRNLSMVLSAIDWAINRDSQLNVPARPISRFQLSLSRLELVRLNYSLLFIVPGIVAVLGCFVYWTRRS